MDDLPKDYQFGDMGPKSAIFCWSDRRLQREWTIKPVFVYDGEVNDFVEIPRA